MTDARPAPLSANEEITLRRVAFGQSDVTHLRAEDLERLRALALVKGSSREPALTPEGKRRFDLLPKAFTLAAYNAQNVLMDTLGRLMARKPRT